jgi:hypothetical protein
MFYVCASGSGGKNDTGLYQLKLRHAEGRLQLPDTAATCWSWRATPRAAVGPQLCGKLADIEA